MSINQSICKSELAQHNHVPRKYYGQVFTTDEDVIQKLIDAIKSIYKPGTKIVEIGGGLGYITDKLIEEFDDIDCVEFDDELFEILLNKFCVHTSCRGRRSASPTNEFIAIKPNKQCNPMNKKFIHDENMACHSDQSGGMNKNFIHQSLSDNINNKNSKKANNKKSDQQSRLRLIKGDILGYRPPKQDYLFVGNIPFHISGKLYRQFMSEVDHKPYGMVFITDKQYATTLMGQPPRCYRVSLQAQSYGDIEIVADVPPTTVYPEPKVMSCIMKIVQNNTKLPDNFWEVVNHHFENFPTSLVKSPKTLSLKDWIKLAKKK